MKMGTLALIVGGVAVAMAVSGTGAASQIADSVKAALARLTRSTTATKLGLSNLPDNSEEQANLLWTGQWADAIIDLLSEIDPGADLASAYRADAVNAAIKGSSKTSLHLVGLALDFGELADPLRALRYLRANLASDNPVVPPSYVREVIAEYSQVHLHVGFWNGRLGETGPTRWEIERGGVYSPLPEGNV